MIQNHEAAAGNKTTSATLTKTNMKEAMQDHSTQHSSETMAHNVLVMKDSNSETHLEEILPASGLILDSENKDTVDREQGFIDKNKQLFQRIPMHILDHVIHTISLYVVFFFFGFNLAAMGPTLPMIAANANFPMGDMGWMFTAKGFGATLGSLLAGKSYDYCALKSRRAPIILLTLAILLMSACLSLLPFMKSFWQLFALYVIFGMGVAFVNMGCNVLLVWFWKEKVTPMILGLSCIAGFGSFLSPIFVASGISFHWLYFIMASLVAASALSLIIAQIIQKLICKNQLAKELDKMNALLPEPEKRMTEQTAAGSSKNELMKESKLKWMINLIGRVRNECIAIVVGTALFGLVGLESSFGGLIFTYLKEQKIITSNHQGAMMISGFYLSITLTRFFMSFASALLKPIVILSVDIIGIFASIFIFLFLPNTMIFAWIGVILFGLTLSTQFPTALSFPQTSMKGVQITGTMTSIMMLQASAGEMIVPVVITSLFKTLGMNSLFWVLLLVAILPLIAYIIMFIWTKRLMKQEAVSDLVMVTEVIEEQQQEQEVLTIDETKIPASEQLASQELPQVLSAIPPRIRERRGSTPVTPAQIPTA
jgi:MFS family permease